jgi:hypothetical protein
MPELSVTDMIIDGLVDQLILTMQTQPAQLKVGNIRAGRLQDNPNADGGLNILVHYDQKGGELSTADGSGRLSAPAYTIGGGVYLQTYFSLEFNFHFDKEQKRDVARRKAGTLLSRLKRAMLLMPMPINPTTQSNTDDFGETAWGIEIVSYSYRESGGVGHFIWTGEMVVRFLTQTSNQ